jgi:phage major head subunit gpT-like protein
MAILNNDAVADARTTYEALFNSALQSNRAQNAWSRVARKVTGTGIAHQTIVPGATPTWTEWVGEKDFGGFRKYARTTPLKTYHKSIELKRSDVVYDKDGSTGAALNTLVRDFDALYDKLVFDKLSANPTGVDGVALLHATHPFGSSTTWDNITSTALSFSEFDTMVEDMMNLKDEFGEPLNLRPRVLVAAVDIRREAMEIVGAEDRPIAVGTAGAINSAGIGATGITNIYKSDNWELIITPRFTAGQWVIIDPDFPPIKLVEWRAPEPIIVDDMTADTRVRQDVFLYGAEADIAADGEQPWGIAGKL